jgi:hypothetical protein
MVATQPSIQTSPFSRTQLVELIISMNPTATPAFLDQFAEPALRGYLEHLTAAQEPRGRSARWLRRADSPAIVSKEAAE